MPKKILLADDSVTIQKVVELTFSEGDYQVSSVSNGRQALQKLQEQKPDILLCDVIMPELNGYEVTAFVKQSPDYMGIPVILLTGTFEPFDEEKAKQCGADSFVTKPFDSKMLVDKVEELLKRRNVIDSSQFLEPAHIFQSRQEFTLDTQPPSDQAIIAAEKAKVPEPPPAEQFFVQDISEFSAPQEVMPSTPEFAAPLPEVAAPPSEFLAPASDFIPPSSRAEEQPTIQPIPQEIVYPPAPLQEIPRVEPIEQVPQFDAPLSQVPEMAAPHQPQFPDPHDAVDLGPIVPETGLPEAAFDAVVQPPPPPAAPPAQEFSLGTPQPQGETQAPEAPSFVPPPAYPAEALHEVQPSQQEIAEVRLPEPPVEGAFKLEDAFAFEPEQDYAAVPPPPAAPVEPPPPPREEHAVFPPPAPPELPVAEQFHPMEKAEPPEAEPFAEEHGAAPAFEVPAAEVPPAGESPVAETPVMHEEPPAFAEQFEAAPPADEIVRGGDFGIPAQGLTEEAIAPADSELAFDSVAVPASPEVPPQVAEMVVPDTEVLEESPYPVQGEFSIPEPEVPATVEPPELPGDIPDEAPEAPAVQAVEDVMPPGGFEAGLEDAAAAAEAVDREAEPEITSALEIAPPGEEFPAMEATVLEASKDMGAVEMAFGSGEEEWKVDQDSHDTGAFASQPPEEPIEAPADMPPVVAAAPVEQPAAAPQPAPPAAAAAVGPEELEAAVRKAIAEMAPDLIRQIAWEVIPELAESIIRTRIRELETQEQ